MYDVVCSILHRGHLQNFVVMQIGHSVEMDIRIPIQRTMGLAYYVMGFDVSI